MISSRLTFLSFLSWLFLQREKWFHLFLLRTYLFGLCGSKLCRFTRGSPLGDERTTSLSLFRKSLSNKLLVGGSLFLVSEDTVHLFGLACTLALQGQRSHQTLNLGRLANSLALLVCEGTGNDILANIIILGQVEKLADIVCTLGTQTTGDRVVGQSLDLLITKLGNNQVQNSNIVSNNASTDGLALSLTGTARSVGLVSLLAQKTNSSIGQDTLTHGEALLVVSTGDAENESLELISQDATVNFLGHAALVQVLETFLIIDFDDFLHSSAGASNIDLKRREDKRETGVQRERKQTKGQGRSLWVGWVANATDILQCQAGRNHDL